MADGSAANNKQQVDQRHAEKYGTRQENLATLHQHILGRNRSNQHRNRNQLDRIAVNYGLNRQDNGNPIQGGTYD